MSISDRNTVWTQYFQFFSANIITNEAVDTLSFLFPAESSKGTCLQVSNVYVQKVIFIYFGFLKELSLPFLTTTSTHKRKG